MPYYETGRTMASLTHKPPYDHLTDTRHRNFNQLWMYFVHNDLIPIYEPNSGIRTWRLELLHDCHFNIILDDFFRTKWNTPEQARPRFFEIRDDYQNECTYGLLAFSDITHGGILTSGDCTLIGRCCDEYKRCYYCAIR